MINPHRRSHLPQAVFQGKEKTKIYAFAILFVIVLAAFLGAIWWADSQRANEAKKAEQRKTGSPIDVAEEQTPDGRTLFRHRPLDARQKRDLAEEDLNTALGEMAAGGVLKDSKPEDSPEVLRFLVNQFTWAHMVGGVGEGLYRRLPEGDAVFEPAPYRGRFTSTWGQIVEVLPEEPFAVEGTGVEKLYRAYLRTEGGRIYYITAFKPIDREPKEWVQVYGIFYRLRPYEVEGVKKQAICLFVGKELKRAYPPLVVTEIDPAWGDQVKEQSQEQAKNTDEPPFWKILNYVEHLGIDGYRALRDTGQISIRRMGRNAKPLISLPEEYRFEHVSALGKVIQAETDVMQSDNPGKIHRLYSAILLQPSEYMVLIVSPRPWSEYGFGIEKDYVEVEGIFYKKWVYVPARAPEARQIPLIIVTDVSKVDDGSSILVSVLPWACGVLAAGLVVLFLGLALRDRRQLVEFRERYAERKRSRGEAPTE